MSWFFKLQKTVKALYTSKYAIITNTLTSGVLTGVQDGSCQLIETYNSNKPIDEIRLKSMMLTSFTLGPLSYLWYRFLDNKFPGKTKVNIMKKILLDVSISPIYFTLFTGTLFFYKGRSSKDTAIEVKNKIPILLLTDVIFWSSLQGFNFMLLPPHYRIVGVKINEFILGVFMSHILNTDYDIWMIKDLLVDKYSEKYSKKD